jgi:4-hydroxy-tetrahydrodipicolinate synthase
MQHAGRLAPLLEALDCAPNPIPVKAGLAELGLCGAGLRLPLLELAPGPARKHLRDTLSSLAGIATP